MRHNFNHPSGVEILDPPASPEEAVAVAAALQQFMDDTAPPLAQPSEQVNPWKRAALLEGVNRHRFV